MLVIPIFQNVGNTAQVVFYKGFSTVTNLYMRALFLGIIDWSLLLLYIQSLLKDIKRQDATKFDLKK